MDAHSANELIVAVVGHVGSGTSTACELIKQALIKIGFDTSILKASHAIAAWAETSGKQLPLEDRADVQRAERLQDLGDEMRKSGDHAAVALELIRKIRGIRAQQIGQPHETAGPVMPDGARRAYILDSVRHPAEVHLLRHLYQTAFALLGVVCDDEEERIRRLTGKFKNLGQEGAMCFMERDSKAKEPHGQRVEQAFHLSDYFLDNSAPRHKKDGRDNPAWGLPEQISRFIQIVTHAEIVRPTIAEAAMYAAFGAKLRSACLSRQVGAALVDRRGNLVASGTNEAPRPGGGVYGQGFEDGSHDGRCAYHGVLKFCSNTREQNDILEKIMGTLIGLLSDMPSTEAQPAGKPVSERKVQTEDLATALEIAKQHVLQHPKELQERLRASGIGGLIEFSRAIHAEMDALLSAARQGISPVGARMFVTTFPCHSCARHLVGAGVDEVQYVEPYPKSKALFLHKDAITTDREAWRPPSQGGNNVLFRPFTGAAPSLYARAFLKERELKDPLTGELRMAAPDWGAPWDIKKSSYVQLEAELLKGEGGRWMGNVVRSTSGSCRRPAGLSRSDPLPRGTSSRSRRPTSRWCYRRRRKRNLRRRAARRRSSLFSRSSAPRSSAFSTWSASPDAGSQSCSGTSGHDGCST